MEVCRGGSVYCQIVYGVGETRRFKRNRISQNSKFLFVQPRYTVLRGRIR